MAASKSKLKKSKPAPKRRGATARRSSASTGRRESEAITLNVNLVLKKSELNRIILVWLQEQGLVTRGFRTAAGTEPNYIGCHVEPPPPNTANCT